MIKWKSIYIYLKLIIYNIKENKVIVNKNLDLDQKAIDKKVKELNKLKLISKDTEEEQQIIAWAERLYVQCSGECRDELQSRMDFFEYKMMVADIYEKMRFKSYMKKYLLVLELAIHKNNEENLKNDESWMDDEDKMIEDLFKDWDGGIK